MAEKQGDQNRKTTEGSSRNPAGQDTKTMTSRDRATEQRTPGKVCGKEKNGKS